MVCAAGTLLQWGRGQSPAPGTTAVRTRFADVAAAAGLTFVHRHSPTADKHYPESVPGGVAVFDYNGDGRPDIFFTNGAEMPSLAQERRRTRQSPLSQRRRHAVHRRHRPRPASAASATRWARRRPTTTTTATSTCFVAGVARNQLLRNRGDGSFEDVTDRAAHRQRRVGRGGRLVRLRQRRSARPAGGQLRALVRAEQPLLRRPVAQAAHLLSSPLLRGPAEPSLSQPRRRHVRGRVGGGGHREARRQGHERRRSPTTTTTATSTRSSPTIRCRTSCSATTATARSPKSALTAGVAVPESGRPISGMGADFQDYDNDGWEDIHLTGHLRRDLPALPQRVRARAAARSSTPPPSSGLARLSASLSGWCSMFVDVDNDGAKDLFVANSHPNDRIERSEALGWKQPNSLFLNDGRGRFRDATVESGLAAARRRSIAAAALADFDGDGRLDIVVLVLGEQAELWHNDGRTGRVLADREPGGDAQQPRRHRRARHRRRSSPDHDHGQRLCVLVACRGAFRAGRRRRAGDRAVEWPSGVEADRRERRAKSARGNHRAGVRCPRSVVRRAARTVWPQRASRSARLQRLRPSWFDRPTDYGPRNRTTDQGSRISAA